jgi:hypothetical protein
VDSESAAFKSLELLLKGQVHTVLSVEKAKTTGYCHNEIGPMKATTDPIS